MPRAKAKVTANVDGDEYESLFVGGSRSKKNKLSHLEEYDEDPGRAGSQKYQKLANIFENCITKEARKSETYLKEFRNMVKQESIKRKTYRQEKEQELAKGQEKSITAFKKFAKQLFDGQARRPCILRKEDHHLFKQAQANEEIYESLLKQFNSVEEQLKVNKEEPPVAKWEQDKQDVKEFLACSGKYAETLIGNALVPNPVINQQNIGEATQVVKNRFKDCQADLDGETWGQVAEEQLKHISAMAK